MFVTVRENAFGEDKVLEFRVGKRTQKCDKEKGEWRWPQRNQFI